MQQGMGYGGMSGYGGMPDMEECKGPNMDTRDRGADILIRIIPTPLCQE